MKAKQTICTALCALLVLWSCNEDNGETPRSQNSELPENAIGFSVLQNIGDELPTRAGDTDKDNLSEMTVYAHNTGTADFEDSPDSTPDVMYNQSVTKDDETWTYTPLQYWPADAGTKISFFAIAPDPTVQANGITIAATNNSYIGYPKFTVTPPATPSSQQDIVVASTLNRTKNIDNGSVPLYFNHAMAKVGFSASYTGGNIPDGGYVKVKQLKLQQVAKSGTFSLSPSSFSWDAVSYEADNLTDYTLSGSDLHDIALSGTSQRISTDASTLKLIPQTPQGAKVALTLLRSNGKGTLDSELAAVELSPATWDAGQEITTPSERRSSRQKEPASTNSKPRERRGATSPSQTAPLYAVAEAVVR